MDRSKNNILPSDAERSVANPLGLQVSSSPRPDAPANPLGLVTSSPSHNLEAKNLTLAYDGAAIIRNLSLAIPAGKTTVLFGANGCGKSTLLRGLTRLLKPKSGLKT